MSWDLKSERLRLKGILSGKPLIGPRAVNIHLTNACDRKCCFCWYFSPMVSWYEKRIDMDLKVLRKVVRDCARMGVEEVNLEGGEVVLYPHVAEVFRMVHAQGMKLAAYTHLAYGPEHLEYLRLADRLSVNLSATTEKSYLRIHGADRFKDVIRNLRMLTAMRKKSGAPAIVLTFIINERNYKEIGAFLELAETLKVARVSFRLFEATSEMAPLVLSPRSAISLRRILAKAIAAKYRVVNNLLRIQEVVCREGFLKHRAVMERTERNNDRLFYYHASAQEKFRCYTGWFNALINEKGQVVAPCDNIGICIAGNVNRRSFKDIWFNSKKFQKVRRDALRGVDITRPRWRECRYCGHVALNKSIDSVLSRADRRPDARQ
jgi:MoaA/NifB/PqqE/SkfB family radical SAM enzyme